MIEESRHDGKWRWAHSALPATVNVLQERRGAEHDINRVRAYALSFLLDIFRVEHWEVALDIEIACAHIRQRAAALVTKVPRKSELVPFP